MFQEKQHKRRISTEGEFMQYNTDDILLGCMLYFATYYPKEEKLYLPKADYVKNRNLLKDICDTSAQTLNNHLKKLAAKGLIQEGKIEKCGKQIDCFFFPFDYNTKYELVDKEMIWYVASTRNCCAFRVYVLLLSWFRYKEKTNEKYDFTNKEIMRRLGYNDTYTQANKAISNILLSFEREGIIKYTEFYKEKIDAETGEVIRYPQKRLDFVAQTVEEIQ